MMRLRGIFYRTLLKKCGENIKVKKGARLEDPDNIELGNEVVFGA